MSCRECSVTPGSRSGWIAAFALVLLLTASLAAKEPSGTSVRVAQNQDVISFSAGGRLLLRYRHVQSPYKPYVDKFFSPMGVQVLRDAPSDHKHHHGLMFGLTADGVNFWEEAEGAGVERSRSTKMLEDSSRRGVHHIGFAQSLEWVNPSDRTVILEERRVLELLTAPDLTATLLSWSSQLTPAGEKSSVALTGAHYVGLGMRFAELLDHGGRFFNADGIEGELVRGSERLASSRWCAYTAPTGDGNVTIAIFDHPTNPHYPDLMFTMTTPFAYLAATLNLWKESITLKRGKSLDLRYGVAVWDGIATPQQIESHYRRWEK